MNADNKPVAIEPEFYVTPDGVYRAAVKELIDADIKYDEAKAEFDSALRNTALSHRGVAPKFSGHSIARFSAAIERRRAALRRVQGGAE